MRQLLLVALIGLAATAIVSAQAGTPKPTIGGGSLEQELKGLLQEMLDARWGLNEKAAAQRKVVGERTLADNYVQILKTAIGLPRLK